MCLMLGCFSIAYYLRIFKNGTFLPGKVSEGYGLGCNNMKILCPLLPSTYMICSSLLPRSCVALAENVTDINLTPVSTLHFTLPVLMSLPSLFPSSPSFKMRRLMGDFGVPIAIFLMIVVDINIEDTYTQVSTGIS